MTNPLSDHLTSQLVDPAHAVLSAGSNVSVTWRCDDDPRHVWNASPNTRKRSPACPVCLNKLIIPGVNDLATTHPQLAAELADPAEAQHVHSGSHKKLRWACPVDARHRWDVSVVSRSTRGSGCPFCSGRLPTPGLNDLATTHPRLSQQLMDQTLATTVGAGSSKKLRWQCAADSAHIWEASVRNRTGSGRAAATGCPDCAKHAAPTRRTGRPPSATLLQAHPEIAAQLVDQSLATQLSKGSDRQVQWQCPEGHQWFARVYNRTNAKNKTGCPVCSGKKVLPGFNDVATTHPETAALLVDTSLATTRTAFSNKPVEFWCSDPDHQPWTAPMSRATAQGSGCGQCSGRRAVPGVDDLATTHPELAAQLADQSLATTLKSGSGQVEWKCPVDPSHTTWHATVHTRITAGSGCPSCSGRIVVPGHSDLATTHPALAAQLADPSLSTTVGKGYSKGVDWVCTTDPTHTWNASPANRVKGVGCPICVNKQVMAGFNDIARTQPELVDLLVDPLDAQRYTAGTGTKLAWRCSHDSSHVWEATPSRLLGPRPAGCSQCFKEHRSAPETQLVQMLRTLLPDEEILIGRRDILASRQELDIVIPGKGVAIEFNGVYWHSDAVLDRPGYHAAKSRAAQEAGYRLIHVWEDDWFDKNDLVVRALAHRLGASADLLRVLPEADPLLTQRIYARSTSIIEVSGRDARAFWQANHLQGPVGSRRYFGLADHEGRLRALLGVGPTNHGSRAKAVPGVWDVQRYATLGTVPGGFTRLLAHATKQLRAEGEAVETWTSFSNDDLSDGGMYQATGFVPDKYQAPSYWYVGSRTDWRRVHRTQFVKQRFVTGSDMVYQEGWTEHEAAHANGLYRIYDSGKTRWVKDVTA